MAKTGYVWVALASAAGALSLVSAVAYGEVTNGFAAVRPPGHHAGPTRARGFCIFNNAAACARFAQVHFNLKKILIVDWDVHPADGTEAIFYDDPDVHVVSVHQEGLFPITCCPPDQIGKDAGAGATWNRVIAPGTRGGEYRKTFDRVVREAAEACQPELIILSCGFDAHAADPVGGLKLDENDYARMTNVIMDLASNYCDNRLVSLLEGGYNPIVLRHSTRAHLEALLAA
ncbi:MAG: acetoin utilization deacetylase AcuC-like enzyme [Planctomycetota bacterium]|jgi:acetoin utilization deacetylase AcuC-like enzyme